MSCCRSWVWIHQAPTPLTWVVQYKETLYMDLLSETVILCISVLPGFLKPISECSVLTPIWNYFLVVLSVVFHLTGFVQHQKWSFFFFYQSKHLISNQNWKKKSVEMIVQTLNKKKRKRKIDFQPKMRQRSCDCDLTFSDQGRVYAFNYRSCYLVFP